ncbi:MAG TPA: hypothetical protein G4N96_14135 [Chloroflexi bacterium]|nr:MAG: hypothetical protein B6243_02295 [Anaerolineaceae bacterium 4572_5.2]HEY86240.1 hypothetical protein [Chloroflexota bacterium]
MEQSADAVSFSWIQVWTKIIGRPTSARFRLLLNDPKASKRRAYVWVFLSAIVAYIIWLSEAMLVGVLGGSYLAYLVFAPGAALLAALVLTLYTGTAYFIARGLGGTGTFSALLYAVATYTAPLLLIAAALSVGGFIMHIAAFALLPALTIFSVIAIKAVYQFGWWAALASMIGGGTLFICGSGALIIFVSTIIFDTPVCAFLGGC